MGKLRLITFYSVFFFLYGVINIYIFLHGYNSILNSFKLPYSILFIICSLSFFGGRFLEKRKISVFSKLFVWIGSLWFAAILYFFLSVVIIDIVIIANLVIHFIPENTNIFSYVFWSDVMFVTALIYYGYLNAKNTRVKTLDIIIQNKPNAKPRKYNIVSVSDIHLGTIIGTKRLKRIIKIIDSLNPDIVLLPGDVVDEDITPVIKQNLGELFRTLKTKYGIFSVTGNHEYIGGVEKAVKYLSEHNIKVLRDEKILIDNNLYIIGREDISAKSFAGKKRKTLEELMAGIDNDLPIILMDHQPYELNQAVINKIDLQLSGHTHHGQMWPLNYFTQKIFELSWGYLKKGNTNFYVSCGAGTWGPPVRIGNTPEIINIKFVVE